LPFAYWVTVRSACPTNPTVDDTPFRSHPSAARACGPRARRDRIPRHQVNRFIGQAPKFTEGHAVRWGRWPVSSRLLDCGRCWRNSDSQTGMGAFQSGGLPHRTLGRARARSAACVVPVRNFTAALNRTPGECPRTAGRKPPDRVLRVGSRRSIPRVEAARGANQRRRPRRVSAHEPDCGSFLRSVQRNGRFRNESSTWKGRKVCRLTGSAYMAQ